MSERKGTKALELWCRRLLNGYEGVSVDNMTTSWRNGLAFCALIHRFRPDLIDYSSLKPENVYENNELAFRTAETHLGIPALLDPEDMVASEVPDRLSLLTYLSQFYRRLGHTVPKSTTDNSNIGSPPRSPLSLQSPESITATLRLGKSYEVCAACELPVYLAQRLLVSRRLYHRSCFRCCSCRTPLSPHACYENAGATEFCCDACRNRQPPSPSSPPTPPPPPPTASDDQRMGMLLFHDPPPQPGGPAQPFIVKNASSISDRIKIFENNEVIKTKDYPDEFRSSWRTSDMVDGKILSSGDKITPEKQDNVFLANVEDLKTDDSKSLEYSDIKKELVITSLPESSFKSNVSKLNFLQTQLCTDDCLESVQEEISQSKSDSVKETCSDMKTSDVVDNDTQDKAHISACLQLDVKIDSNVPDDIRLEEKLTKSCKISDSCLNQDKCESEDNKHAMQETSIIESPIIIPPRRRFGGNKKSLLPSKELNADKNEDISKESINKSLTVYPTDLNPFSEDETEVSVVETNTASKESTNPFGSSDDDDEPPHVHSLSPHFKAQTNLNQSEAPRQSLTPAPNPFWSDGEEPSSDEGDMGKSSDKSGMYGKSSVTCSTPNLAAARRKKARAPRPPPPRPPSPRHLDAPLIHVGAISMDDTASLSSMSSHCSTAHSDYKSNLKLTPKSRKKRPAPTPPDNTSMISSESGSGNKSSLIQGKHLFADEPENSEGGGWRRVKGPAPGLPLPGRRVVRPELTPAALQTQLDLLETQQLGLERQGVLIEQMIRDRCEGESCILANSSPTGGGWRRVKGPAPGLPLPGRRVVRPELTPAALQTQLDLLETQQLGLERQGVLIEQMIRDRCEGESCILANSSPTGGGWRRVKGPAPGLPLPGRRVVRPELTPAALQTQLDLLETQQLGLERQGVLIEQMIRDRCEGESCILANSSPTGGGWRRVKGPAPGLPLPGRRVVRPELTPAALQTQLDLLETQQLGLERQGVLIEQMIRDRCEGESCILANSSPTGGGWRRVKGPAPGLPLPGRRVVRPELTPAALQTQLDLLETQQLGLERQGVLIEQMIRDRCEGEAGAAGAAEAVAGAEATPAQDVEELVIQLCELVNEKNDLFRKQAELMYIRRQQRLEQEQADIEHEIRIIQSRPAVNRIDADKAREEALVARLVGVVRLRDELVQQLDSERRRERAEDAAIARSIAERRAKRNSDSNNSSLQSEEIIRTPKKSKVKDRVKKQFKKAKNTLHPKKKDSEGKDNKEHNGEKKEKSKWF